MDKQSDGPKRKFNKLIPLTLLAFGSFSAAAVILLRRARIRAANEFVHALPRRTSHGAIAPRTIQPQLQELRVPINEKSPTTDQYGPLYAFGALGIATCLVGASATACVYATRWSLGIRNMEEFGDRMRTNVRSLPPTLLKRMHADSYESSAFSDAELDALLEAGEEELTWAAAKARWSRAYDEGGVSSWMEAVTRDLDREEQLERRRRVRRTRVYDG